jgi:predicted HTH transcriptional regulator
MLFARRLSDFGERFERRAPRVIFYEGDTRAQTRFEQDGKLGYALGLEGLFKWLESLLPRSEQLRGVIRQERPQYPSDALRELVANALIHQDFSVKGAGPMIEVFDHRIEISNPGRPLIDVDRLLDEPPRSRNERLAYLMRQMHFCEERGSGIDKVVFAAEVYQLPPPAFEVKSAGFVATLFGPRAFAEMTNEEKTRACYQHACLLWVAGGKPMTNSTLRQRFGLGSDRASQVSRLIADAVDAGVIKYTDPSNRSRAQASYQPYWT